jgi:hypothetical protein
MATKRSKTSSPDIFTVWSEDRSRQLGTVRRTFLPSQGTNRKTPEPLYAAYDMGGELVVGDRPTFREAAAFLDVPVRDFEVMAPLAGEQFTQVEVEGVVVAETRHLELSY